MNRLGIASALLLLGFSPAVAQDTGRYQTSGQVSAGAQTVNNDTSSSKLNEYRDLSDGVTIPRLRLDLFDTSGGRFLEIGGTSLTRDDRSSSLRAGSAGVWGVDVKWIETPHLLSNRAQTPYFDQGGGLFTVPGAVPITFKKLATAGGDASKVVASDDLIAAYALASIHPTALGTDRERGSVAVRYTAMDAIKLRLGYQTTAKSGSKLGYGPIGDRPPRTLNIQLAEPVDYRTQDVRLEVEHVGKGYQVQAQYLVSDFANAIDTFTWQNVFATPAAGAQFDAWDRQVAAFGRRPLAPDNQYKNAAVTFGADLPLDSRLTATASYGRLEQDQSLLPYAYHATSLADSTLPRSTAEARIDTTHFQAAYSLSPVSRLNLRAHYRYYDLDNKTPESQWNYVTSDTSNLNGTVSYQNKRVNLAYDYGTQNLGFDATYRLGFWNGSLGVGYEREEVERRYREADTTENRWTASLRARPAKGVILRARYLLGDRDGGVYNGTVTQQSYWYTAADAGTSNDNPRATFSNHPDMRRYDVSDRKRAQADVSASLTRSAFTATASIRYRKDDFDSEVQASQPLLATTLADRLAATPGDQLGLLEDKRLRYGLDLAYAVGDRFSVNVFGSVETADGRQRGLEFNEGNKQNPSAVATAELGPWTRGSSEWTADSDDRIGSLGLGANYVLVKDKITVAANYTVSRGKLDIDYQGYGVTNWDGTPFPTNHQFAFGNAPTIRHEIDVLDLALEYKVGKNLALGLGYIFDRYKLQDWQQETSTAWYESVGSEYLLRDTSRSNQWGNRLFNLGSYLAPGYEAHVGYVTVTYRF